MHKLDNPLVSADDEKENVTFTCIHIVGLDDIVQVIETCDVLRIVLEMDNTHDAALHTAPAWLKR